MSTEVLTTTSGVELEAPAPDTTVVEPPAEETEQPAEIPDEPSEPETPQLRGTVKELVELRRQVKEQREQLEQLSRDPVLQRLTPDLRQAIADGRVLVGPQTTGADQERERLTAVAQEIGLIKADGTPDLDAARRVDTMVRRTAGEVVAPIRHMTLREKAVSNVNEAITYAQSQGVDVDTVRAVYAEVMAQPNGAELLSQPEVAKTVWFQALGRAAAAGKIATPKKPAAGTRPAAVITEPAGRRTPSSSPIQLSPQIAAVYESHKMDPKAGVDVSQIKVTRNGAVEL